MESNNSPESSSGKPIKVCMLAYSSYTYDARIKSYVKILLNQGIKVDLIVLKDTNQSNVQIENQSRVFRVSSKYRGSNTILYVLSYIYFFVASFFKLSRMCLKEQYSVIHIHNMPNFLVFSSLLPKLFGAKVILDIHDLLIPIYMVKFNVNGRNWVVRFLSWEQKISSRFASNVICADHMQKETLLREYKIPEDKITVMMNLPHEEIFKLVKVDKDPLSFNLIYHGTIAKRLGVDLMLQAVSQIRDKIPVRLSIYGTGDFLDEVMELQKKLGMEDIVYISGSSVPTEKLSDIICRMDVGIIANRRNLATDKYMMPVKLMEYAYLKVPVIAPRLRIIQHYFDENMVKFFEPENVNELSQCILGLFHNKEERLRFAENAVKFFDVYNNKSKSSSYLNLVAKNHSHN